MLLAGKRVVVAGIGPGLGRSIAVGAATEGASVALVARSADAVDALSKELADAGHSVVGISGDVTRTDDCRRVAEETRGALGGIDTVVYNAYSNGTDQPFAEADLDGWRAVMDVNCFGALELVQACLPELQRARGSVVLIGSRQMRRPTRAHYAMSKAALLVAGQALAHELGPTGVRVNSVVPGWMWGPPVEAFFGSQVEATGKTVDEQYRQVADQFPLREIATASDVAEAIIFLASDRAKAITGQALDVNAGEIFH